jgi:hypothetical protein
VSGDVASPVIHLVLSAPPANVLDGEALLQKIVDNVRLGFSNKQKIPVEKRKRKMNCFAVVSVFFLTCTFRHWRLV